VNFDILGNWKGGAIKDAGDEAIRLHGNQALNNIDIGTLEGMYGANTDDVKNYIRSKQQQALNNNPQIQAAAVAAGLKPFEQSGGFANYGEGLSGVMSRINTAQETKTEGTRQQRLTETIEAEGRAQGRALEVGQQGITAANNRFSTQLESQRLDNQANRDQQNAQYAHTTQQNRLDRGLERELSSNNQEMQLALGQMNADLADKRMDYDRETRRMDKRSAAIAQLMSGLGSLGGAFAL
jgi:hypothetical protein